MNMTFEDAIKLVSEEEKFKDVKDLDVIIKKMIDEEKELNKEKLFQLLDKYIESIEKEKKEEKREELKDDEKDSVKLFWGDEYEEIVGDDSWGREYAEMLADILQGEDEELAKQLTDAKLTAAGRKRLSKSVFCKPPRGYPVHDCPHAKAAMAYAKKYNESSSVVACIRRKAKRLGCPFKSDQSKTMDSADLGEFVIGYFDRFEDKELIQMFDGLQEALKDRDLDCGCEDKIEDRIKDLQEKLDTARKENRFLHTDIEQLQNSLAETELVVRQDKYEKIINLKILSGEEFETAKFTDELNEKSTEEITEILKDYTSKVDMNKIADRLNSGLSNNPHGVVEDPTMQMNNLNQPESKEELLKRIQWVNDNYLALRLQSQSKANEFLNRCKIDGIIPAELPVEKKS